MEKTNFDTGMNVWRTPEKLALITSVDSFGKPQIITVGWIMRVSFEPPVFAIAINSTRTMHNCIKESNEFNIAIPGAALAAATFGCGESNANGEDRFVKFGLETDKGEYIKSPIITNAIANFECLVTDSVSAGDHTIFLGKVMETWVSDKPGQNLLIAGDQAGYEVLLEKGPYKLGIVRE